MASGIGYSLEVVTADKTVVLGYAWATGEGREWRERALNAERNFDFENIITPTHLVGGKKIWRSGKVEELTADELVQVEAAGANKDVLVFERLGL